jgi:hypothetical protein
LHLFHVGPLHLTHDFQHLIASGPSTSVADSRAANCVAFLTMGKDEKEKKEKKREKDEDKMDEDQDEEEEEVPAILSVIAVPLAKDKLVKKLLKLVKAGEGLNGLQTRCLCCAKLCFCMLGIASPAPVFPCSHQIRARGCMCDF